MSLPLTPFSTLPTGFTAFTHDGVLLAYSPSTGEGVRWITHAGKGGKAFQWAAIAAGTATNGYTQVRINSTSPKWHRIVAQHFINGGKPIPVELEVDHRKHADGTTYQDRIENLRLVTKRENGQNRRKGSSRYPGVSWSKREGKWKAYAQNPLTGKNRHLGTFADERLAAQAYIDFCVKCELPHTPALAALELDLV